MSSGSSISQTRWHFAHCTVLLCSVNKPSTMTLFTGEQPDAYTQSSCPWQWHTVSWPGVGKNSKFWNWMMIHPNALIRFASPRHTNSTAKSLAHGSDVCRTADPDRCSPMSAPSWCMAEVLALATLLCDASQYLAITVRNKLVYSRYMHSPLRGEIQSQLRAPLKVQAEIHSQSSSPSDCLLCPTLLFFWQSHNDAWYK